MPRAAIARPRAALRGARDSAPQGNVVKVYALDSEEEKAVTEKAMAAWTAEKAAAEKAAADKKLWKHPALSQLSMEPANRQRQSIRWSLHSWMASTKPWHT